MNRTLTGPIILMALAFVACSSSSQTSDREGSPGTGGTGEVVDQRGSGGSNATAGIPLFVRADCGSIPTSDIKASASQPTPATLVPGQVVGGRVDPDSLANQEHYWVVQLPAGFYHLVLDSRTADGASANLGIRVTWRPANGSEQRLFSGNEIARHYRDGAFFEVKVPGLVQLKVSSVFNLEDYLMGVFANGTPVPSPIFASCPPVTPLTLAQPVSFTLGAAGTASGEQWFLVDLALGNYKFALEAAQASGESTNLAYGVAVLDRFGQEARVTHILRPNEIGRSHGAQGMLSVGETGSYWVRLRNSFKDLNVMMTVSAQ